MDELLTNTVVVSVVVLVVGYIVNSAIKYAGAHLGTIADKAKGTLFESAVAHLTEVIDSALTGTGSLFVTELKKAAEDGKITTEELDQIVQEVKSEVLSVVGPQTKAIFEEFVGDIEKWVEIKVRSLVVKWYGEQQQTENQSNG